MTNLTSWMIKNGNSDGDVAKTLGMSRTQIMRIRNGKSNPSVVTAQKLSELTGIPAWDFLKPVAGAPKELASAVAVEPPASG